MMVEHKAVIKVLPVLNTFQNSKWKLKKKNRKEMVSFAFHETSHAKDQKIRNCVSVFVYMAFSPGMCSIISIRLHKLSTYTHIYSYIAFAIHQMLYYIAAEWIADSSESCHSNYMKRANVQCCIHSDCSTYSEWKRRERKRKKCHRLAKITNQIESFKWLYHWDIGHIHAHMCENENKNEMGEKGKSSTILL